MKLEVENVTAGYGNITVLRDVSFKVNSGGIMGVLGRNGMGKSTLIKCLAGLILPAEGAIKLHGEDISNLLIELISGVNFWKP